MAGNHSGSLRSTARRQSLLGCQQLGVFSLGPTLLSCDQATQSKEYCAESICFLLKFALNSLPKESFDGK